MAAATFLRSAPDVLASTANYLAGYGWQRGKDWEAGGANFAVIQQWNKSEVYSRTIGYFATQLARAPVKYRPAARKENQPFATHAFGAQILVSPNFFFFFLHAPLVVIRLITNPF